MNEREKMQELTTYQEIARRHAAGHSENKIAFELDVDPDVVDLVLSMTRRELATALAPLLVTQAREARLGMN